jgi:hypothetical protein
MFILSMRKLFILIVLKLYLLFKDDKYNGYAMALFEHATRDFDSSCLG